MDKLHKYFGIMLLLFLTMAFVLGILIPTENVKIYEKQTAPLTEGWQITETNGDNTFVSDFSAKNLRLIKGSSITLLRTITFPEGSKPVIGYYDQGLHVMAFVNDRLIYESGKVSAEAYGEETGSVWRCIPLRGIESGSQIKMFFENNTAAKKFIYFSKMYLCEENQIYYSILKESSMPIFVSLVCIVIGFLLLIFSFVTKNGTLKKYSHGSFSLGALTITMGLWVISDSNFFQLIFHTPSVRYGLSYVSFLLLPYYMLYFYMYLVDEEFSVFKTTSNLYVITVFVCILLNLLNVIHISKSLICIHLFLIIEFILVTSICIKHYKNNKNKRFLVPMFLSIFFLVFILISCGFYYLFPDRASISTFIGSGYLLFLLTVFFVYGRHIIKVLNINSGD